MLLHRHAARILNELDDLETEMRHQGPTPISVLRLGILASIATTLTPGLVALAKKGFGVRDVTLHAGQSTDHETCCEPARPTSRSHRTRSTTWRAWNVMRYCRSHSCWWCRRTTEGPPTA